MDEMWKQITQYQVDGMNAEVGNLQDGFDCPICRNKGRIFVADNDGYIYSRECECMGRRKAVRAVLATGADNLLKKHTFADYTHTTAWQDGIYKKALEFAEQDSGFWFIGGQYGSGKTAISISILNRLLERGKECRYYVWDDLYEEVNKLMINDDYAYERKIKELSKIEVLYLDDFVRRQYTEAEMKFAFKIINNRYMANLGGAKLLTLISSQKTIFELMSVDGAIASRICEIGVKYVTSIDKDENKNWRMKLYMEQLKKNTI